MTSKHPKHLLDFTLGDALLPFDSVASYALKRSLKNQNQYICNKPDYISMSQPLMDVFDSMAPWLAENKFIQNTKAEKENIKNRSLLTGGGASEGFEYILRLLMYDVTRQNKQRQKQKLPPIKPVILTPVPAYGFFMNMIKQCNIMIGTVKRDVENGGALDIENIKSGIKKLEQNNFRIIAYLDSNPNNPTGLIRDEKETRAIADLLIKTNKHYKKQDAAQNCEWDGPASQISIIDDLVYHGTEYEGFDSAYSFAQIPECRKNTFLLLGLSKIGLAGLRAGYLLSPMAHAKNLRLLQQNLSYFASRPAIYGCEAFFNSQEPFKTNRQHHIKALAHAHQHAGHLIKALINGMDTMDELNDVHKKDLIVTVKKHKNLNDTEALAYLNSPIKGTKILTSPQSGFFHILSMKGLRGFKRKASPDKLKDKNISEYFFTMETEADINGHFSEDQNMLILGARWMGYGDGTEMLFRLSYAFSDADLIDGADRMKAFANGLIDP